MHIRHQGFTLIELMIVVAIVGILAVIAIPTYQNNIVRAKVTEGLVLAGEAKTIVMENALNAQPFQQGFQTPHTKNVDSIEITETTGVITINFSSAANSLVLNLTPTYKENNEVNGTSTALDGDANQSQIPTGTIEWSCSVKEEAMQKYVPSSCQNVTTT